MKTDDELMSDRLDWIERAAIENMRTHHACADNLAKDSAATLTLLLIGIGGGLAYSVKAIDAHSWNWLVVGSTAFTLWLVGVSWYLVGRCMMITAMPQIFNSPKTLNAPSTRLTSSKSLSCWGLRFASSRQSRGTTSLGTH